MENASIPYSRQESLRFALRRILAGLGLDVRLKIQEDESSVRAVLSGPDVRFLKMKGGAGLRGLEHLAEKLMAKDPRFEKTPHLEIEGQREEEENRLRAEALTTARKVRETKEPIQLPPLNPFQRRIVHLALRDEADLVTYSTGSGHDRRLNVALRENAPPEALAASPADEEE